jgi:hypothetical protein
MFYTGKTTWLNYALYRCLLEKRPVIWRYMDSSVLFVDEGVYHFTELAKSASFRKVVWTLVDSAPLRASIPDGLFGIDLPYFIIFATSLTEGRWSSFRQVYRLVVVVMNPWTRGEIHRA